jgi:hypothetical protein
MEKFEVNVYLDAAATRTVVVEAESDVEAAEKAKDFVVKNTDSTLWLCEEYEVSCIPHDARPCGAQTPLTPEVITTVDLSDTEDFGFVITGKISIPRDAELLFDADNNIMGYVAPDGREIKLRVSLDADGTALFKDSMMATVGASIFEYTDASFIDLS